MGFPQVGLEAVFLVEQFEKAAAKYEKTIGKISGTTEQTAQQMQASGKNMAKSFEDFAASSVELNKIMETAAPEKSLQAYQELGTLWRDMGKPKIDTAAFDALVGKGTDITTAFRAAAGDVTALGTAGASTGMSLQAMAAAAGQILVVVGALAAGIKQAVAAYSELASAARQLYYELGATAQESSTWAAAARLAGISSDTLGRAIGILSKNVANMAIKSADGSAESSTFSQALTALGVSARNADGSLKSANVLMSELQAAFQRLGPGVTTTGLAMDVFGRSAYQMLPLLLNTTNSLDAAAQKAIELGTVMSTQDLQAYTAFNRAALESKEALKGLWATLGREIIPALTWLSEKITQVIGTFRQLIVMSAAGWKGISVLQQGGTIAQAQAAMNAQLLKMVGLGDEASRKEETLAQAQNAQAQAAALAADEQAKLNEKLQGLSEQRADRLAQLALQESRQIQDTAIQRRREMEDAARQTRRQIDDMERENARRREEIERDAGKRRVKLESDWQQKQDDAVKDAQKQRESLEQQHQERLYQINQSYRNTVTEAARRNDAVAIAQAMRQRQRELTEEERQQGLKQTNLEEDLQERRQRLVEERQREIVEEQQRYQEALASLQENEAQQQAALRISLTRQAEDRRISWQRQNEDMQRAKARQMEDLNTWYAEEQAKLQTNLATQTQIAVQAVQNAGQQIAAATTTALAAVAAAGIDMTEAEANRRRNEFLGGSTGGLSRQEQWRARHHFMAEGGAMVVRRPTDFTAGEKGPEVAAFWPLSGNNRLDIGGRLGVDVNGVPGGLDRAQVNAMIFSAITEIARQVRTGRVR